MKNPTHSFRETNPMLQLIEESQIKSKTVMSWSSRKKNEGLFLPLALFEGHFLTCLLPQCIVY